MRQVAEIIVAEKEKKAVVLSACHGGRSCGAVHLRTRSEEGRDAFLKDFTRLHPT